MRKASACASEEEPKECSYKSRKYKGTHNCRCDQTPSWIDALSTYLNDWANLAGEYPATESGKKNKVNQDQTPGGPSTSANERTSEDTHIEFLKNIGENISQFLDPLGIDVNVQVKTDKASEATEATGNKSSAAVSKDSQDKKSDDTPPMSTSMDSERKKCDHKPSTSTSMDSQAKKSVTSADWNKTTVNETKQRTPEPNAAAEAVQELTGTASPKKMPSIYNVTEKQVNQLAQDTGCLKIDDWTLLDKDPLSQRAQPSCLHSLAA